MIDLNAQNEAIDALRELVGIFIWYPADERSPEYPIEPVTRIDLGDTEITDAELVYLQQFPALEWLCLEDTEITDEGLSHLASLVQLRQLEIRNTRVTEAGIRSLRRVLPNCEIIQ